MKPIEAITATLKNEIDVQTSRVKGLTDDLHSKIDDIIKTAQGLRNELFYDCSSEIDRDAMVERIAYCADMIDFYNERLRGEQRRLSDRERLLKIATGETEL